MENKKTITQKLSIWLGRTVILSVILIIVLGGISLISNAQKLQPTIEEKYFTDKYDATILEEKIAKTATPYREFKVLKDNVEWRVFEAKESIVKYNESLKSGLK